MNSGFERRGGAQLWGDIVAPLKPIAKFPVIGGRVGVQPLQWDIQTICRAKA